MIDLSISAWLLAIAVVFVGSLVQGIIGYGVGLFSAPLLFLIHPALVPAPLLIIGGILPMLVLRANAHAVVVRDLAVAWPGGLVGVVMAYLLVGQLAQDTWQWLFGALIIVAVLVSALRFHIAPTAAAIFTGSLFAGCMGTITGVGGPPLGVAFQHAAPARIRGTLSAIFVPMSVMSLTALFFLGRLGWRDVALALAMMPAVFLGFWCARRLGALVPQQWYKAFVLGTALAAGGYSIVIGVL